MKAYAKPCKYGLTNPPPSFEYPELFYTKEEIKQMKIEEKEKEENDKEYWYSRHDPNKGLLYILKNLDKFPYTNLLNYNKMEIKNIKESGKSLDQISCLPKFCCFMGDGEHYLVYNKKASYNIAKEVQTLFNKKYVLN